MMDWVNKNRSLLLIGMISVGVIGVLSLFLLQPEPKADWQLTDATTETTEEKSATKTSDKTVIMVDIKGQVAKPGVYELPAESRLNQLVAMAGGLTKEAEAKQLNLAVILQDQQMIYVPHRDEAPVQAANGQVAGQTDVNSEGQINLNTADLSQLQELNGIGEKKAQAIIDYREENGGFKTVDELTEVSGIGEKTLEKLKDEVAV